MIPNGRVLRATSQCRCLFQPGTSLFQPAFAKQHPPQAVDKSGIVRVILYVNSRTELFLLPIQLKGPANEAFRLFQVFALVGPKVAQIIVGGGIVRVSLKNEPKLLLRFGEITHGRINVVQNVANGADLLWLVKFLGKGLSFGQGFMISFRLNEYAYPTEAH